MTDNEIIKALECCKGKGCKGCPCNINSSICIAHLARNALDLIKRQKAEIEKLKEALHECRKHEVLDCTK